MRALGALLLFAPLFCAGQFDVDCAHRDFFEVRSELRNYYENLLISDSTNSEVFGEGGKFSNFKRWEEFWSTRIPPGKTIEDFEIAKKASYQALEAKRLLPKSNLDSWHEIGPIDKPNSGHPIISPGNQNSEAGIGPIHFISFCDADAGGNIALCGSASGGLFYRDISAMSQWSNAGSDSWPYSGCRHAVFKVGTCDVIFAANSNWVGSIGGIHRYEPVGQIWEQIADESDLEFWSMIKKLHTDANDANVLYAATTDGLYRTTDANGNDPQWNKIVLPNPIDPVYGSYIFDNSQHIEDLEMEPGNSQHIYISVKFHGRDPNDPDHFVNFWTVLQSINGGQNWTPVPNIPTDDWETYEETDNMYELITLEVSPANNNALWVQIDNFDAPGTGSLYNDELFKYTNTINGLGTSLHSGFRTWYGDGHGFGVSLVNENKVYLTNEDHYFTYDNGSITSYYSSSPNHDQYHVDVEDFVERPGHADEIWMANHGSINRSTDGGVTWDFQGQGLGVADCFGTSNSYSEPGRIAIGLYHDGNILSDGNYAPGWQPNWWQLGGFDGQHPMIDPVQGSNIYWHSQANNWFKRSIDYGISETGVSGIPTAWDTHNVMDPKQPNIFYVLSHSKIKRTIDNGNSFETVFDLPSFFGIPVGLFRLHIAPSNPEFLYVNAQLYFPAPSHSGQRILRTTIARAGVSSVLNSWEVMPLPLIPDPDNVGQLIEKNYNLWIGDVVVDNHDPNVVYYGFSSSLGYTPSASGTEMLYRMDYNLAPGTPGYQTDLTGTGSTSLPSAGGGQICLERGSNGGIYFGTDVGVFYTNIDYQNDGTGWVLFGPDLPHISIRDLDINYVANKIRASLPGRGVWEHDLYCPGLIDAAESGTYTGDLFLEVQNVVSSTAIVPDNHNISYRAGSEIHLQPGFNAAGGSQFHAFIHPCSESGNSFKNNLILTNNPEYTNSSSNLLTDKTIRIYPNPTSNGQVNIELLDDNNAIVTVHIFNILGEQLTIRTVSHSSNNWMVQMPDIPGSYFVRVINSSGHVFNCNVQVQ